MFGYRLVPDDLYARMLAALDAPRVVAPVVVPASVPLPAAAVLDAGVIAACEEFGFGDADETSQNYRRAAELTAKGWPAREVVRAIRAGADLTGRTL